MKQFFKVIKQLEPFSITKQDGTQLTKRQIVLQLIGGKYEDSFVCTLLGNAAQCKFYENDLVYTSLSFRHNEYQGKFYQDITVQDIINFTQH